MKNIFIRLDEFDIENKNESSDFINTRKKTFNDELKQEIIMFKQNNNLHLLLEELNTLRKNLAIES